MTIIQIAEIVIGSIISLGVLIAGAGYGYGQFYAGRNKQVKEQSEKTKEDFALFNTRLDALKQVCDEQEREITAHKDDIKKLNHEIGRLQGINEEKEKKIKELTDLLSNRDPALAEYIKYGRESIEYFKTTIEEVKTLLENK